jgi:hypothetical protein
LAYSGEGTKEYEFSYKPSCFIIVRSLFLSYKRSSKLDKVILFFLVIPISSISISENLLEEGYSYSNLEERIFSFSIATVLIYITLKILPSIILSQPATLFYYSGSLDLSLYSLFS